MSRRRSGSENEQLEDMLRIPCGVRLTHFVLRHKDCLIIRQALRDLGLEQIALKHRLETSISVDVLIAAFVAHGWTPTMNGTAHELSRGESKVAFPELEAELRVRLTGDVEKETGNGILVLEPVACLWNQRWTCFAGCEGAVKELLTELTFAAMGARYSGSRLFKLWSPLQFRFINMGG